MAFPLFSPSLQQSQQSPFQSPTTTFQQQQQQPQQLFFPSQLQQQQQQQQQQQHQQVHYLFTTEKAPATYQTKWSELHPDSQNILLKIEEQILEYRDESQRLDQCARLFDTSVSNDAFEVDFSRIVQELGGISTAMEREKVALQQLMTVAKGMIRNAEVAVRSFMMLQPRFVHPIASATSSSTSAQTSSGIAAIPSTAAQPKPASIIPTFDFYSGYPKRPSPFLQQTVLRFGKRITECTQWIEELEHLLLSVTDDLKGSSSDAAVLQTLPTVISNVHDFFVHVAAKVETLHQHIESMRTAYLADQRLRGDGNDPFLEADRRETAKREASAKRVHPTLHVPTFSQPSTQAAGLFSSAGESQVPVVQLPAGTSSSSSSGFSVFSTPTSSATSGSSLSSFSFSTPSASAPTSTIFGASGSSQQTSSFGTPSASSLFATPQTNSLSGAAIPFASTPATGSSPFSVTPAFGAATGSGASFGAGTKTSKPKSRTTRR